MRGLGLLAVLLFQVSCACWNDPEKMHTEGCVVAREIVSCATQDVSSLLPIGKPILDYFLDGMSGSVDWGAVLKALEWVGFDKAICIIEQLQKTYTGPSSAKLKTDGGFDAYLRKKYPKLVVKP